MLRVVAIRASPGGIGGAVIPGRGRRSGGPDEASPDGKLNATVFVIGQVLTPPAIEVLRS